jgi:hypothetical protein
MTDPQHPALRFLGVRYLFLHPASVESPTESWPDLAVVYQGPDAVVLENRRALPRVFLPQAGEVIEDPEAAVIRALELTAPEVVTVGGLGLPPGRHRNGEARLLALSVAPGRIAIEVEAETAALVATSQPAIPGWRVFRDGEELEPLRVNGAFLGALAPPGRSRVEMVYRPASWRWGWVLFALGGTGCLVAACGSRRPREARR